MKIDTALILCAGFGKRLNPITLDTPKPLLELNNVALLETCINLIENLGIRKIIINTFYLGDQISNFIKNKNFISKIKIIDEGKTILDTGGGILNMINHSNENNFLVFNPDTLWHKDYLDEIVKMEEFYYSKNQKQKAKEFFNQIIILSNSNSDIKLESQKRLNRDFSE